MKAEAGLEFKTCNRFTHKSFMVFLRDDLTEWYVAYEFETKSACSPDINLQTHKSSVRQTKVSLLYCWVIMSTFVCVKKNICCVHCFSLFNQKKKAVESHLLVES